MTNGEKFKTAKERAEAFHYWWMEHGACKPLYVSEAAFNWLDLEAESEERQDTNSEIKIGDTVAYRSLEDDGPEWSCFTVRGIDKNFLYEHKDKSGDNISIGSCYKVNVPRVGFEQKEKPLPCPFCGGRVQVIHDTQAIAENAKWLVNCYGCQYEYGANTKEKLIAAHNRVARAAAKEKEANDA